MTARLLLRTRFVVLVLVLLSGLAYVNTLFHPFLYDDLKLVLQNPEIRSLSKLPALVGFRDGGFEPRARFTRDVAYALEYALAGPSPPLYHLTNILLHGCAGALIFLLVSRVAGSALLGWWTAALFVLHPIGTDVVAQISGRREILATLFALATLVLVAPEGFAAGSGGRTAFAAFSLSLGVFSKEMAVMAPLALPLLDLYALPAVPCAAGADIQELGRALRAVLRRRWFPYASLLAVMAALTAVRLFISEGGADLHGSPGFYETQAGGVSVLDRLRLAGLGMRLLLIPAGQSADYSFDALGIVSGGGSAVKILDIAVLGGAVAATVIGLMRRSWVGLGGAWYFLFYLPTAGIVPWHEIFAERFLYLPSVGFHIVVASALVALQGRWRRAGTTLGLLLLCGLVAATVTRNGVWSSAERLWSDAVSRYPSCARAHKALADAYMSRGRPGEALLHYREAVRILPPHRDARIGIAMALAELGRHDEAVAAFEDVLRHWPEDPKTLNDLGMLYENQGLDDKALDLFKRAMRSGPELAEPYNNLARLYATKGDLHTTVRLYQQALERDPSLIPALRNLATIYRYGFKDEKSARIYDERVRNLLTVR